MANRKGDEHARRRSQIEVFEPRYMMSADALVDLAANTDSQLDLQVEYTEVAPALESVHQNSGAQQVANNYGFDGSGQTVAVIDSGIAWDHYALGGGYGENYRVVGGYDFAERDSNPYDDGPAGFHGTHVAGIIGSDDATHQGVASGVDLVGLRVFDDYGAGKLEWVEQALQWVHKNRNSFENPITTVNLSLGIRWNSNSIPDWTTLEDEFAQLSADGIFVSVAAGNDFQDYLEKGLSYPAASSHVVPVASHDSDGNLSDFSQRNNRIIAAPGEQIKSTVPNHLLGLTGSANQFYSVSGTSMAAPYVAGASTLLREAFEFSGRTNITQSALLNHFRSTADNVFDQVTDTVYKRLNLEAAIDAAIPDLHGDTIGRSTNLGNVTGSLNVNGTIGKFTDNDYLSFQATKSGTFTFTLDSTHDLNADVSVIGDSLSKTGNEYSVEVEAGKTYTIRIGSDAGIGHYTIDGNLEAAFSVRATDWGTVDFASRNIQLNGESWHKVTTSQDGILTVQANYNQSANSVKLELYDSNFQKISTSNNATGQQRIDLNSTGGQEFYVRLSGDNSNVEVTVANLVKTTGNQVFVAGTDQSDTFELKLGSRVDLTVNGTAYQFDANNFEAFHLDGNQGNDSVKFTGSARAEEIVLVGKNTTISNELVTVSAREFEQNTVIGSLEDSAVLRDTSGSDQLIARVEFVTMSSSHYRNSVSGIRETLAVSRDGNDSAKFFDSVGDDKFISSAHRATMRGEDFQHIARGFEVVSAYSTAGHDTAVFHDSINDDVFTSRANFAKMEGLNFSNRAFDFARVNADSQNGNDISRLYGDQGDDVVTLSETRASIRTSQSLAVAKGFDQIHVDSGEGLDKVSVNGISQNRASQTQTQTTIETSNVTIVTEHAEQIRFNNNTLTQAAFESMDTAESDGSEIDNLAVSRFDNLSRTQNTDSTSSAVNHALEEIDALDFLFDQAGTTD